jgi:hypothetical protein
MHTLQVPFMKACIAHELEKLILEKEGLYRLPINLPCVDARAGVNDAGFP